MQEERRAQRIGSSRIERSSRIYTELSGDDKEHDNPGAEVTTMNFSVLEEGNKFVIRDEDGNVYGSYETKKEAEDNAVLWREYYKSPLIF
ncbi:MAG: hypothetical protein OK457_00655 [Thaumarchaeota archaeon]|nr:hypothetical protein [Nitrososphaerota archaeon]